ncbi:Arm DNA-binding domain-containing protein [Rossellomorea marisflavi]|uniref:Arm DNA-binding domain-containing protein n=1 Tax=Rossellomorea marisflavi TaxID=189381 RepID=UPI003080468E
MRKSGFRTKKEAQVAASEIEEDLRKGIVPTLKKEPFEQYFNKTNISEITLKMYQTRYKLSKKALVENQFRISPSVNIKLFLMNMGKLMLKKRLES